MSEPQSAEPSASRREFLGSTAGLTGATLASQLAMTRLITPVHAASDETLKVALVGCGGRGAGAAVQALNTAGPVKLWAMADAFEQPIRLSLESFQRGLPARYDRDATAGLGERIAVPEERQFVGLDAYRKAIDSGVDVVILAGPPGFRPLHFDYAVRAGKHVFMEKPVATDAPGVRRVLAVASEAKRKNLKVGVGLQRRHQASYQEAMLRVHEGMLGEIHTLRCYWNGGAPAKTPMARNDMSELEYQVRNWYFFTWLSGDHICEQHIHNIDVCNWAMQAQPVTAEGMGGRQVRTGAEYGHIFDHHMVEFTYANGTKLFSQCRQMPGCVNRVAEHAHGANGLLDFGRTSIITAKGNEIWRSSSRAEGAANPYQAEQDDLFEAIRKDTPYNEAEYGALSTMTAILGRMATYSGKAVSWKDAIESKRQLTTDAEAWNAEAPIQPNQNGQYAVAVPGKTKVL